MGKDRLYFLTFISILLVFILGASIGINYSIKITINLLLEQKIEAGKKEVQKLTYFLNKASNNTGDSSNLITDIQEILYAVEPGLTHIAVFDNEDHLVCHPKMMQIHKNYKISRKLNDMVNHMISLGYVHDVLMDYKNSIHEGSTINILEVIYEKPIKNTTLKVASIISLDNLLIHIMKLKRRLYTIFILMGVIIITISFFTVRFIASFYEKQLETKNTDLENDIINITKLNLGLFTYQQRVSSNTNIIKEEKETEPLKESNDSYKLRILGYKGSEIIPIFTESISYVYTETSVTYIIDKKGKKIVSNASLDEIYKDLNATLFFRANRQFIINIMTIEKIIKYGNNQLKIVVNNSDDLILIKKNKAAAFRKWLNI